MKTSFIETYFRHHVANVTMQQFYCFYKQDVKY